MRIWLPTVRAGTGTDVFSRGLADALNRRGIHAQLTWYPHAAEWLPWIMRRPPPPGTDLVHVNSWHGASLVDLKLPLVSTLHICVHDPALEPFKSFAQSRYHRFYIRNREELCLARSEVVTSVSYATAVQAARVFGYEGIRVIPNWVNTDLFTPGTRALTYAKPFRLLFAGNPSRRKGFDLLAPLMKILGPDYELQFTPGSRRATDWGVLPSNMRPTPPGLNAAQMIELYRAADAMVFPSRMEGLSSAMLEAQACGLPIAAFDVSSQGEIVVDGVTGLLVPREDVIALAEACRRLRGDGQLLQDMREAARDRAVNLFSERIVVPQYITMYQRALG